MWAGHGQGEKIRRVAERREGTKEGRGDNLEKRREDKFKKFCKKIV